MTEEEVLAIVVGIIFAVLGMALILRYKKLSSHKYFRILIVFVAIMLIGFGVYMGISGFYW